ncbi:hypothetical protein LUZ60_004675 [Juncus effusus]|nr:hypothetical protein LUZ60_004675 [Juncus effusus]
MHPEPLPPLYNHYTLDRRPLSHPDLLDRRPLTQQVPLERRPLAHPDPLDRRPLPQSDLDRRMLAQPDGLERRTISLSDGSVRTYFALPPDPPRAPHVINQLPLHQSHPPQLISLSQPGLNPVHQSHGGGGNKGGERSGAGPSGMKRKNEDEESHISKREKTGIIDKEKEKENKKADKDKGKAPAVVDKKALLEAFLKFSKLINENSSQKKNYLSTGRHGPLRCLVCGSDSKDFKDVKAIVMHAHYSMKLITEHRGLHRALCVLIGWDPHADPKNSRVYQQGLSAEQAQANKDDLILWPPMIVIQNTNSSSKKDGRVEGMGNREIDSKLLDLGFTGGKAKSLYGKEGHQGVTLVKFSDTPAGLKEAERLSEFFQKTGQGRKNWEENKNNDNKLFDVNGKNKDLVKEYGSGEKRVLYGYLATASDLEIFDSDAKKRAVVKSRKDSELLK